MSALSYLIHLPQWWYIDRTKWWSRFASRSLLLLSDRLAVAPQFQALFAPYHNDTTIVGRSIGFAMRLLWLVLGVVVLLAAVLVLVVGFSGWLLMPIGLIWGVIWGQWWLLLGLLATSASLAVYWFGYALQPKYILADLINPETNQFDLPVAQDLREYASGAARSILKDLPPQFSTGIIMRALANDADVLRLCKRMELSDQPLLARISQQSSRQSQVVSEQVFIGQAIQRGLDHHHRHLTTSDLFLALIASSDLMQKILSELGVQLDELDKAVAWVEAEQRQRGRWKWWTDEHFRRLGGVDRGWVSGWTPTARRFSLDITNEVSSGRVPYIIGRDKEIGQVMRILERSTKSNVLLLGEPGVGKSSIVDGIAQAILQAQVSPALAESRVIELDVTGMLSSIGAGQDFQTVFSKVLQELTAARTILFIDAIEHLVDQSGLGTVNASAVLEPFLESGQLKVVGSTTLAAYHRILQPQAALAQHFQPVAIEEPSVEAATAIVQEFAATIEQDQKVQISLPAISATVELAQRYIHDRVLPEKAIDLLDEVAAEVSRNKKDQVTAEDVARVVSDKTGIPVDTVTESEAAKLNNLEELLQKRVVGQEEAVEAVANALRRSRAGLADESKPIAVLMFVGPTGTGKTELAKTVAESYFGSESAMIRLDMSEYQTADSLHKLIGPPPGQADFELGGQLTTAIQDNPYTVLLLDELEKANPRILDVFLQVFDDGHLTDSAGRRTLFNHTVIICTSNAGSRSIQSALQQGYTLQQMAPAIKEMLAQKYFRPEFLNRFDDVVVFKPLAESQILQITRKMIQEVISGLAAKNITVTISDDLVAAIAKAGYDPLYGARPLRHVIQDKLENALAKQLLSGEVKAGSVVELNTSNVSV